MATINEEIELRRLLAPLANVEPVARRRELRRQRRRVATVVAIAAAALLAVAAMAATNTWIFSRAHGDVFGVEHVQFHGKPYTLQLQASGDGRSFGLTLSRGYWPEPVPHDGSIVFSAGGSSILAAPGVKNLPLLPHPPHPTGPAFGAKNYDLEGGQIWLGDARPEVARIVVTDNHGKVFSTETSPPPPNIKLAFRFWMIALPASSGDTIAGYDSHGKLIEKRSIWGLVQAMNLH